MHLLLQQILSTVQIYSLMSGSWQRLGYDEDAYAHELEENDHRINLAITSPAICNPCRIPQPGFLAGCGVSVDPNMQLIDIESDLSNRNWLLSKCPGNSFKPFCPAARDNQEGYPCGGGVVRGPENNQARLKHLPECNFTQIETRTIMPPCTLRGTGWDRFDALCQSPQEESSWHFPGESNISYRNILKDNFQKCNPTPLDQTLALPKGEGAVPCISLSGTACGAFIGDLEPERRSNPFPAGYKTTSPLSMR